MSTELNTDLQTRAVMAVLQGEPPDRVAERAGVSTAQLEGWAQGLVQRIHQFHDRAPFPAPDTGDLRLGDLANALDNIGAYVYIKDREGRYTYANRLTRELFNRELDDIIGRFDADFFTADTVGDIQEHDRLVLEDGQTIRDEEYVHPHSQLDLRVYWTVKIPLFDDDGQIRGLCGISTDITERKQMELTLRNNQELLSTVLDNIGACVYMKSKDGRYLYANAATAALFQRQAEQLIGLRDTDLFPLDVAEQFRNLDTQALTASDKVSGMEIFRFADEEPRYYWSVKVPLKSDNGKVYSILGMSTDITERKRLEDELLRLATTDDLTGLYNRRHFMSLSEQTLNRSHRYKEPLTLLMCDLDFFKQINDAHGHATGDRVLQQIADIIRATLRDTDIAGRIGGEEFAILLVQTPLNHAQEVAERLRQRIQDSELLGLSGQRVPLTVSIGIAVPGTAGDTVSTLLHQADNALYQAKRLGRNRVCMAR